MSYNTFHSFQIPVGKAHHAELEVLGMDGQMHKVKMLVDTGNDITLITRETAQGKLGINPDTIPESANFDVYGITDKPVVAKEIQNMIRIGSLRPVWVPMGIVSEYGAFAEDLWGRRGMLDNGLYEIIYDEDSVDFREKHMNLNMQIEDNMNRPSSELRESFKAVRNPNWYPLA